MAELKNEKIGVVGSGLIGRSWAMLFAAAGYDVWIYDIEPKQVSSALENILVQLKDLDKAGLLRGKLSVEEQHQRIRGTNDFDECVSGTKYVQECVPEDLSLKRQIFERMDKVVGDKTVLASSTSSMPASTFSEKLKHRNQVIVSHPTNPPFYCPLTEVVPAPWTDPWVRDTTMAVMKEIGQSPVLLKKEVKGFVLNRMQYALMNECWRLIMDDVISVQDLDKVMSDGLGMRYAFIGPLETAHLNAEGMLSYCDRYGEMIYKITSDFGPVPKWEGPVADQIASEMNETIPIEKLVERRRWRDTRLSALAKLKMDLKTDN